MAQTCATDASVRVFRGLRSVTPPATPALDTRWVAGSEAPADGPGYDQQNFYSSALLLPLRMCRKTPVRSVMIVSGITTPNITNANVSVNSGLVAAMMIEAV